MGRSEKELIAAFTALCGAAKAFRAERGCMPIGPQSMRILQDVIAGRQMKAMG